MNPNPRLDELNTRLIRIVEQIRLREKTVKDLQSIETTLRNQTQRLEELEHLLKKEQVDVDTLEGLSLTGLFYRVLGSREEQVQKERQELLKAQLLCQTTRRSVETLRDDQNRLRETLESFSDLDAGYKRLLAEKEILLRQANPGLAQELLALSERQAQANANQTEIEQALAAGNQAWTALRQVISSLESAEGWGAWDMLGGGFLATAVKHSRIDDARANVDEFQHNLERFQRELADVRELAQVHIDIDGLDTFADFFFDGLIVDWMVQSSIENSLREARQADELVSQTLDRLVQLKQDLQKQGDELRLRRERLIEEGKE